MFTLVATIKSVKSEIRSISLSSHSIMGEGELKFNLDISATEV